MSRTKAEMNTPVQYSKTGFRSVLFVIGTPHLYGAMRDKQGPVGQLQGIFRRFPKALLNAIAGRVLRSLL